MYDAIVVGARCAGSPTAMLLARKGHRVLVVDRATFPSDTLSTHMIHAPGVAALAPLGPARRGDHGGLPADRALLLRLRPDHDRGHPAPVDGVSAAYAPRRTVLDKILVDAAGARRAPRSASASPSTRSSSRTAPSSASAATARTARSVVERARVVIGADGRNSQSPGGAAPSSYHEKPRLPVELLHLLAADLPVDGFEIVIRPDRGWAAIPTNDGLTMLVVGWPYAEAAAYKADVEANYLKTLELAPSSPSASARRRARSASPAAAVPNFFRKPFGPGWALVGDAGYNKDPITAQGISDAFRDAELCATALDETFTGRRSFDDAMAAYQRPATRRRSDLRVHDADWPRSSHRRRRCSSCSAPCAGTSRPWTRSSASPPAPCHRPSSSTPPTSAGCWRRCDRRSDRGRRPSARQATLGR